MVIATALSTAPGIHRGTPAPTPRRAGLKQPLRGQWLWTFVTVCALLAPGIARSQESAIGQDTLPQVWLQAGIHRIHAEVASTEPQRQQGLMFRTTMGPSNGMLFVFEEPGVYCFWMRNTLLPLSIAFLDDEGTVVTLADMEPRSERNHCPAKPVRHALEMNQGWFQRHGITTGSRIRGLETLSRDGKTPG